MSYGQHIICFHNPNEINGILSNWWKGTFIWDGVKFSSAEQAMMYAKAKRFNDLEALNKIMSTSDVRKIKQYGREVRNYDEKVWGRERYGIVRSIIEQKILTNEQVLAELKKYPKDSLFCECAVKDRIWGIGLSMTDPRRFDTRQWNGQNYLGKIWTEMKRLYG